MSVAKDVNLTIQDITHSRELYEAKPKPFVGAFIYIFLIILVIAMVFMSVGQIDIVTKANGIVRPNQQVSNIKTLLSGEVGAVHYENGNWVDKGDVLAELNHEKQDSLLKLYQQQINQKQDELEKLKTYKACIKESTNLFEETDEVYFNKYKQFQLNKQLSEHELTYTNELSEEKLKAAKEQLATLSSNNHYLRLLEDSIIGGKTVLANTTGDIAGYYKIQYDEYIMAQKNIEQQYEDQALQVKLGQNTKLAETNLAEAKLEQFGYQTIKQCIDQNKNIFETIESTQTQYTRAQVLAHEQSYNNYILELGVLNNTYAQKETEYNQKLAALGSTATQEEVDKAKNEMDDALTALNTYKTNYYVQITNKLTQLEASLLELSATHETEKSKDTILKNNETSKQMALEQLKNNTISALRKQKVTNEASIEQLKQTQKQLGLEQSKAIMDEETGEFLVISQYEVNELVTTLDSIKSLEMELDQLKAQEEQIQQEIAQAIIVANQSGKANVITDILAGDTVVAGTQLLTIVPEDDTTYKVQIALGNKDVAKIAEGNQIKYHFAALPYEEYGELTGEITKISSDAQINETTGQSFYNVESTLNEQLMVNYKGENGKVKVGMVCEAQVITGRKSILRFLLEKIDILD